MPAANQQVLRWGGVPDWLLLRAGLPEHRDGLRDLGGVCGAADRSGQTGRGAQPLRPHPHAFGALDRQLATLLAGQAAIAVTAALRHYDEVTLSDHLRTALSSQSVIDQAIGIIMVHQRGTPAQAFAALRAISQRRNIKPRVMAAELVDTIGRTEPATGTEPQPASASVPSVGDFSRSSGGG